LLGPLEFEVDTPAGWVPISQVAKWAEEQKHEDERDRLAETNSTIKCLVDQLKEKEDQIEMVRILLKSEVKAI
jgi:hypothetical protein